MTFSKLLSQLIFSNCFNVLFIAYMGQLDIVHEFPASASAIWYNIHSWYYVKVALLYAPNYFTPLFLMRQSMVRTLLIY